MLVTLTFVLKSVRYRVQSCWTGVGKNLTAADWNVWGRGGEGGYVPVPFRVVWWAWRQWWSCVPRAFARSPRWCLPEDPASRRTHDGTDNPGTQHQQHTSHDADHGIMTSSIHPGQLSLLSTLGLIRGYSPARLDELIENAGVQEHETHTGGKWVSANGQWQFYAAAGKVTVSLASHQPCSRSVCGTFTHGL